MALCCPALRTPHNFKYRVARVAQNAWLKDLISVCNHTGSQSSVSHSGTRFPGGRSHHLRCAGGTGRGSGIRSHH